jgi:hypothetical protein
MLCANNAEILTLKQVVLIVTTGRLLMLFLNANTKFGLLRCRGFLNGCLNNQ